MLKLPENIEYGEMMRPRRTFAIRKICEKYTDGQILDVGCGNGKKTIMFGQLGVNILGIDVDAHEIQIAQASNTGEHVRFECKSIQDVTEIFSGVVLIEVLEHIENPAMFLKEIYRVCRDDGFLILTVPNGYCLKERFTAVVHGSGRAHPRIAQGIKWFRKLVKRDEAFNESQHVQWFTLRRLRTLLEDAGFNVQEEIYYSVWSTLLWVCVPWLKLPLWMKEVEKILERHLPPYLLEGWGLLCIKNSQ